MRALTGTLAAKTRQTVEVNILEMKVYPVLVSFLGSRKHQVTCHFPPPAANLTFTSAETGPEVVSHLWAKITENQRRNRGNRAKDLPLDKSNAS